MASKMRSKSGLLLRLSGVMFLVYLANVLTGKTSVLLDGGPVVFFNDVVEFLTLFCSTALFVAAVLVRESEESAKNVQTSGETRPHV